MGKVNVVFLILVVFVADTSSQSETWKSPSSVNVATRSVWSSKPTRKSSQTWKINPGAGDDANGDDRLPSWNPITPSPRAHNGMTYSRNRINQFADSLQRNVNKWTRRAPKKQIVPQKHSYPDVRFANSIRGSVDYKQPWSSAHSDSHNAPRRNTGTQSHHLWKDQTDPTPLTSHWSKYDENENSLSSIQNSHSKSSLDKTFAKRNFKDDKRIDNWRKSVNSQTSYLQDINSRNTSPRKQFNSMTGFVRDKPWFREAENRFHKSVQSNNLQIQNNNKGSVTNQNHGLNKPQRTASSNWKSNGNTPLGKVMNHDFQAKRRISSNQINNRKPEPKKLIVKKYFVPSISQTTQNSRRVISDDAPWNKGKHQRIVKAGFQNRNTKPDVQSIIKTKQTRNKQKNVPVKFIKVKKVLKEPIVWKDNDILYVLYNENNSKTKIPNQRAIPTSASPPQRKPEHRNRNLNSRKIEKFSRLLSKPIAKGNIPVIRSKTVKQQKPREKGKVNTPPLIQRFHTGRTLRTGNLLKMNTNRQKVNIHRQNPTEQFIQVAKKNKYTQNAEIPAKLDSQRAANFQHALSNTTSQRTINTEVFVDKTENKAVENIQWTNQQIVPRKWMKTIQTMTQGSKQNVNINNQLPKVSVSSTSDNGETSASKYNQLFKPNTRHVPGDRIKQQQHHQTRHQTGHQTRHQIRHQTRGHFSNTLNHRQQSNNFRLNTNNRNVPELNSRQSRIAMPIGFSGSAANKPIVQVFPTEKMPNFRLPLQEVSDKRHAANDISSLIDKKQADVKRQTSHNVQTEPEQTRNKHNVLHTTETQVLGTSPDIDRNSGSNVMPHEVSKSHQSLSIPTSTKTFQDIKLNEDKPLDIGNYIKHVDVVDTNIQPKLNSAPDNPVRDGVFSKQQVMNSGYIDFQTQFVGTRDKSNNIVSHVSRDKVVRESEPGKDLHIVNHQNQRTTNNQFSGSESSFAVEANKSNGNSFEVNMISQTSNNIPPIDKRLKNFPELQRQSLYPGHLFNKLSSMEISRPVSQKEIVQMSLNPLSTRRIDIMTPENNFQSDNKDHLPNTLRSVNKLQSQKMNINSTNIPEAPSVVDRRSKMHHDQEPVLSSGPEITGSGTTLTDTIQQVQEAYPKQNVVLFNTQTDSLQNWSQSTQAPPSDILSKTKTNIAANQNGGGQIENSINYYGVFESSPVDLKSVTLQDVPVHDIPSDALSSILVSLGNGKTLSNIETLHITPTSLTNGNSHNIEQKKEGSVQNIILQDNNVNVNNEISFSHSQSDWRPNFLLQEGVNQDIHSSRIIGDSRALNTHDSNKNPLAGFESGLVHNPSSGPSGFNNETHHSSPTNDIQQEAISVKYDVRHPDGQLTREAFDVLARNVQRIVKFTYDGTMKSYDIDKYMVIDRQTNMFGFRANRDNCFVGTAQPSLFESFETIQHKTTGIHSKDIIIDGNPKLFFYIETTPMSYNELNRTAGTYIVGSCGTANIFKINMIDYKAIKTSNGDVIPGEACPFGKPLRNPTSWHVVPCPDGKCASVGHTCNTQFSICCPDMPYSTECTSLSIGQVCVQRLDQSSVP